MAATRSIPRFSPASGSDFAQASMKLAREIVEQTGAVFKGLWLPVDRGPFVVFESPAGLGLILVLPLANLTVEAVQERLAELEG